MRKPESTKDVMSPFADRIRRENEAESKLAEKLQQTAFAEALRLGQEMGRKDPQLKKVILFGSTIPGRDFRSQTDFDIVIAELEADARDIRGLVEENARALGRIEHGANDPLDWAALGYTIHNVYGVMENYCLRIAKFFENGLAQDAWHKELLRRMTLTIGDLRPAFLDERAFLLIDELRSFRHVFRNLYAKPLDPQRVSIVQEKLKPAAESFLEAHDAYVIKLHIIAEQVG